MMKTPLRLRALAESDLDWVCDLEGRSQFSPWSRALFLDALAPPYWSRVLWQGGQRQGFMVWQRVLDEATLMNIAVEPEQRGRGLGRHLLEAGCRHLQDAGCVQLFLEVRASNQPALNLYRHTGWMLAGRRRDYYATASGREDALVMSRTLPPAPDPTAGSLP